MCKSCHVYEGLYGCVINVIYAVDVSYRFKMFPVSSDDLRGIQYRSQRHVSTPVRDQWRHDLKKQSAKANFHFVRPFQLRTLRWFSRLTREWRCPGWRKICIAQTLANGKLLLSLPNQRLVAFTLDTNSNRIVLTCASPSPIAAHIWSPLPFPS